MAHESRFLGSARLIAACTLLSRITGLARDIVLNRAFGQNWVQDAFNYGFLVPNLFRRLFGEGALSAVFIPTFTEVLEKEGRPRAWALLGRVTALLAVILTAVTLVLELAALAVHHSAPGGSMRGLQAGLSAVMLPFMVSICLLALFSSILNCLGHFAVPALMPIVLNLMNMFGVLVVGPMLGTAAETQVYGVAWSVLAASVLQLLLIVPVMRSRGVRLELSLRGDAPQVRQMAGMFLPVVLGQGVLLFSVFFDAQVCTFLTRGPGDPAAFRLLGAEIAYPMGEGALSAVNNAQRLYQFPLGVLAISLATAAFPLFSRCASRGDYGGLRAALGQSLRVAMFEGLPCAVALVVLAEPITRLLFEYGRYGPEDSARAAAVLKWYALGMPAYCCQHLLLRGFYSLKDTLTPMWIGCGLVALNAGINLSLVWQPALREAAFGIGTAVTSTLHVGISIWLLRRRLAGRIGGRQFAASAMKSALAGLAAGAAAWWVQGRLAGFAVDELGRIGGRAAGVFVPLGAAAAAYLGAARAMGMEELGWLLPWRRRGEAAG
jgi:putative peptidoglycan lipid II flippase